MDVQKILNVLNVNERTKYIKYNKYANWIYKMSIQNILNIQSEYTK